jgi:hypothetical protein
MSKRKLSRKELKQQQEMQKRQIRGRQGWQQQSEARARQPELLMPVMADTREEMLANMIDALRESEVLIGEEEFEAILFAPLESFEIFIEVAEEMGWSADRLHDLEGEALEDAYFDIIQSCAPRVLTKERQGEVLEALRNCYGRLQQQGKQELADQVGVIQYVLSDKKFGKQGWQLTSLVHNLIRRSVMAGFALVESTHLGEVESPPLEQLLDMIREKGVNRKLERVLERIPGLNDYLQKQAGEVWDKGEEAVYKGELYLGLFAEEELQVVDGLIAQFLAPVLKRKAAKEEAQKIMPQFVEELEAYLGHVFAESAFG